MAEGQDPLDPSSELDPDRECPYLYIDPETNYPVFTEDFDFILQKFSALSPCKNNCRGGKNIQKEEMCLKVKFDYCYSVNFSVVSGGAALIAATSVAGQVAPAIGAALLGLGGAVGGNMVAQNMCLGNMNLK